MRTLGCVTSAVARRAVVHTLGCVTSAVACRAVVHTLGCVTSAVARCAVIVLVLSPAVQTIGSIGFDAFSHVVTM